MPNGASLKMMSSKIMRADGAIKDGLERLGDVVKTRVATGTTSILSKAIATNCWSERD